MLVNTMAAALHSPVTGPVVPGLERLKQLATVNVHQTTSGYNGNNYTVLGENEPLFTMNEDVPDTVFRGGAHRAFIFDGVDNTGMKVFRFLRAEGFVFISDTIELFMNDQLASIIRMEKTFMTPIFSITDPQGQRVVRLKGTISETAFFQLQTNDKTQIGSIQRRKRSFKEEFLSYNDDFLINFPADLAMPYKLAVIVAVVYIDFRFYEGK